MSRKESLAKKSVDGAARVISFNICTNEHLLAPNRWKTINIGDLRSLSPLHFR